MDPIQVFVGTDDYQMIGARVLAHSITSHTNSPVDIHYLNDYVAPVPKNPGLQSKTGFSFTRFMIPEICNYSGRAIYLDADMLVFSDIAELWNWQMDDGVSLLYADQPPERGRRPQYSVFVVDCAKARWDAKKLMRDLDDGKYDYNALVYEFSHMLDREKAKTLPFRWNALEYYDKASTSLIHFTDMNRQPWVEPTNTNGKIFYDAVNAAIDAGAIGIADIKQAIDQGYIHPAFLKWIGRSKSSNPFHDFNWPAPYFRLLPMHQRLIARFKRLPALL
ncbi:glycosyl transferase [Neorhizobium sp. P12A]|jgi:lipopolysaccharide biosynthesis glycosyltransferase|uniref:glycosyltransferase n=1 Tax=Neorhizobium sp. P12A TaxID=2268027 RepID=UPI0011EFE2C3|nr:glycosyltransferase [Neorhizobium sp. P12A]KAA0685038.1 glycosyl transferase [Neorhizobium sp. P12A]